MAGAPSLTVRLATDSGAHSAHLIGQYPPDDLAVIQLDQVPATVTPARFADSSKLTVGQIVLAMGNPLGLASSVTNGIISAIGRTVSEPQSPGAPGATIADAIQTSAAINPGNSGGALVDTDGQVVGIPTLAATDPELGNSAAPGIGFAIPSNTVTDIAGQIVQHGDVVNSHRAALGVTVAGVVDDTGQPLGAGVTQVTPGGPADKAGIKPGDVIIAVNSTATPDVTTLSDILATLRPGQTVPVRFLRGHQTSTVHVTLGQLPSGRRHNADLATSNVSSRGRVPNIATPCNAC